MTKEPGIVRVDYDPPNEARRRLVRFHLQCRCGEHHEASFDRRVNEAVSFDAFLTAVGEAFDSCARCKAEQSEEERRRADRVAELEDVAGQMREAKAAMDRVTAQGASKACDLCGRPELHEHGAGDESADPVRTLWNGAEHVEIPMTTSAPPTLPTGEVPAE